MLLGEILKFASVAVFKKPLKFPNNFKQNWAAEKHSDDIAHMKFIIYMIHHMPNQNTGPAARI